MKRGKVKEGGGGGRKPYFMIITPKTHRMWFVHVRLENLQTKSAAVQIRRLPSMRVLWENLLGMKI